MLLQCLVYIALILLPSTTAIPEWYQDDWGNLTNEVQTHLQSVVAERYPQLYWDMYQNCNSTTKPQAVIHLQIFNDTEKNIGKFEMVLWEKKQAPCSIHIFFPSDDVLTFWCEGQPNRVLVFSYNHTDDVFWANDQNFVAIVKTDCLYFKEGKDHPCPSPFDYRHDKFSRYMILLILSIVAAIVLSFLYCHRVPLNTYFKHRWINYRDRREWKQIHDIIEYRQKMINDEQERKFMEKIMAESRSDSARVQTTCV